VSDDGPRFAVVDQLHRVVLTEALRELTPLAKRLVELGLADDRRIGMALLNAYLLGVKAGAGDEFTAEYPHLFDPLALDDVTLGGRVRPPEPPGNGTEPRCSTRSRR
jgi:hypothetical protein